MSVEDLRRQLEEAQATFEELQECGDLEDRLMAALEVTTIGRHLRLAERLATVVDGSMTPEIREVERSLDEIIEGYSADDAPPAIEIKPKGPDDASNHYERASTVFRGRGGCHGCGSMEIGAHYGDCPTLEWLE